MKQLGHLKQSTTLIHQKVLNNFKLINTNLTPLTLQLSYQWQQQKF